MFIYEYLLNKTYVFAFYNRVFRRNTFQIRFLVKTCCVSHHFTLKIQSIRPMTIESKVNSGCHWSPRRSTSQSCQGGGKTERWPGAACVPCLPLTYEKQRFSKYLSLHYILVGSLYKITEKVKVVTGNSGDPHLEALNMAAKKIHDRYYNFCYWIA